MDVVDYAIKVYCFKFIQRIKVRSTVKTVLHNSAIVAINAFHAPCTPYQPYIYITYIPAAYISI